MEPVEPRMDKFFIMFPGYLFQDYMNIINNRRIAKGLEGPSEISNIDFRILNIEVCFWPPLQHSILIGS